MRRLRGLVLMAAAALFAGACGGTSSPPAATPSALPAGVLTHIEIPPITAKTGSIDIMVIDQETHLLYVADRTDSAVDVIDVSKPYGRYLRSIDLGGTAPNGVILAKDQNKLYTGNNDSTVSVIDIRTFKVINTLKTGGKNRADELDYDPKDHKIYIANSNDGFLTVIDTTTDKIIKKFDKLSEGGLEQPRYDTADGMFYLTLSDDNVIVQFDPTKDVLVKKFDVGVQCNPQGLAINPKTNQALLGCGNRKKPMAVLWDLKAGKVISTFDKTGAGDMTLYDEKADRFFFAASNFSSGGTAAPNLAIFNATPPVALLATMPTALGSHSVAYDETNKVIYIQDQKDFDGGLFAFPLPR